MSFNVLVIPEDATKDHYILKPVISALMGAVGKGTANVRVLLDPAVQGIDQALSDTFLAEVIERYPMVDMFLLCVDRDGNPGRDASIADREQHTNALLVEPRSFFGSAAHQEVEVWCLAGMDDLPTEWAWQEVRSEPDPKEHYYEPYAAGRGLLDGPGDGREVLGREAATRYKAIRSRCDEVVQLETRIAAAVA